MHRHLELRRLTVILTCAQPIADGRFASSDGRLDLRAARYDAALQNEEAAQRTSARLCGPSRQRAASWSPCALPRDMVTAILVQLEGHGRIRIRECAVLRRANFQRHGGIRAPRCRSAFILPSISVCSAANALKANCSFSPPRSVEQLLSRRPVAFATSRSNSSRLRINRLPMFMACQVHKVDNLPVFTKSSFNA